LRIHWKIGKGIIQWIANASPRRLPTGNDRVFAYLRLASKPKRRRCRVAALEKRASVGAHHAANTYNLGQNVRWEIATAVAGSIWGSTPSISGRRSQQIETKN